MNVGVCFKEAYYVCNTYSPTGVNRALDGPCSLSLIFSACLGPVGFRRGISHQGLQRNIFLKLTKRNACQRSHHVSISRGSSCAGQLERGRREPQVSNLWSQRPQVLTCPDLCAGSGDVQMELCIEGGCRECAAATTREKGTVDLSLAFCTCTHSQESSTNTIAS